MEFIGNNRRQCNSNSARPFEKGRPGLKVVSVPERTQVGDGAPWHRGRGQRCLEIPALPPPSLPLPEQQLAQGQAELQSPDRLPDLELVVQEPLPPPDSAAPRMGRGGGGGGGRGSQQPGMGPVSFCWSVTRFEVQLAF